MIEIVFGESACGSLKIAQTYGKGKYRGSAVSVFMRHEDGSVPSSDEMKEAQIQAQEQEHIAWENAIPLGGKSSDVYCFDMALSVGDISDNGIGEQRKNVFKKMLSVCFVEDLDYQVEEKIQKIKTTLSSVIERYVAGEEVRIWYSYNPDELCDRAVFLRQFQVRDVVISDKDIINSVFRYSWFQFAHVPYLLWKQARLVLTQSHR